MDELTRFEMKNSLTLPSSATKFFNSSRDENDEPIDTYNDEYMKWFVRQSIEGGRCSAVNQYYNSIVSVEVHNIFSIELNINGNVCVILDKYVQFKNKQRRIIEDEYDSRFEDNQDVNEDEKTKYVNDKLSKLTIHTNKKTTS